MVGVRRRAGCCAVVVAVGGNMCVELLRLFANDGWLRVDAILLTEVRLTIATYYIPGTIKRCTITSRNLF